MINVNEKFIEQINSMEEAMVEIESTGEIKYCHIQESIEGGYDYTYFDKDYCEIDGGDCEINDEMEGMGEVLDKLLDSETDGEYVIIQILSEDEKEDILESEYEDMFDGGRRGMNSISEIE